LATLYAAGVVDVRTIQALASIANKLDESGLYSEADRLTLVLRKIARTQDMHEELCEFFLENPNPSDKKVHEWAEKHDYTPQEVEREIYKMATEFVNLCKGGLSKGEDPDDLDPKELKMGIKIEKEHTKSADVARKIALDHLHEHRNYYTALKKMEKELGEE
jgi:hypothetical protein